MVGVDCEGVVACGHVVFLKEFVDLPGNREPAQSVRPQVAEIRLPLAGGIICAGKRRFGVSLQRVVQLDLIAVGVDEGRCKAGHCQRERQAQRQQDTEQFFHFLFLL